MPATSQRLKISEVLTNNAFEVLITIAFVAVLMVVAVPAVGTLRQKSHVKQIVALAEELSQATHRYQEDCGQFAVEFSISAQGNSYTQPHYHHLSMPQDQKGWNGPYIAEPLTNKDNPFGGSVYVQNNLSCSPANGFSLDGVTGKKSTGPGQFVVFHGVTETMGKEIDKILDKGVVGRKRWKETGRVEWAPGGGGSLSICLLNNERN